MGELVASISKVPKREGEKPSFRHCEPFGWAQDKLREAISPLWVCFVVPITSGLLAMTSHTTSKAIHKSGAGLTSSQHPLNF